ncbi:hypothetical protein KP509_14G054000 [Ceratopteris richardii]|uniref:Uncharacterized protein n=1 Tax=Ceratopteris richardii TaxID=49495 RepID=A0A8T2TBT1_CERRI|nr:hypothetical protein KP509_14G054000 [Ceratopteris richardii]
MDGDRVPSRDIITRYLIRTAAIVFLVFLVSFIGVILGVVDFVFPFTKWLEASKRNDMALGYVRSQFQSKFQRALSQLNRATSTVRGRILFHSWGGASLMLLCFNLGIISGCIGVRSFIGGSQAEEQREDDLFPPSSIHGCRHDR